MDLNENVSLSTDIDLATVPLFQGYPDSLLHFALACCVIFILIGIPGNLITIIALWNCKKFRNATAIFIINLHVNNLIFCCMILPMTAVIYSTKRWIFGTIMCNIYPLMKYSLGATGLFTVVAITVNRYVMVCHPHIYPRFYKRKILVISLLSTWVTGFALFLPSFFGVWGSFGLEQIGGNCTMVADRYNVNPKMFFLGLAFGGPYLIISICYSRIWMTVRKTTKKRNDHNNRAMQPTISTSDSDPSVAENGLVCELTDNESSADDASKLTSPVSLTPNGRESAIVQFFKTSFRITKKENSGHLPNRKDRKLATMILAIIISFTMCHFPLMLTRAMYGSYKSNPYANILAHILEYCAAFISPIIYVIMSSEYRQAYKSLFEDIKNKITILFKR